MQIPKTVIENMGKADSSPFGCDSIEQKSGKSFLISLCFPYRLCRKVRPAAEPVRERRELPVPDPARHGPLERGRAAGRAIHEDVPLHYGQRTGHKPGRTTVISKRLNNEESQRERITYLHCLVTDFALHCSLVPRRAATPGWVLRASVETCAPAMNLVPTATNEIWRKYQ